MHFTACIQYKNIFTVCCFAEYQHLNVKLCIIQNQLNFNLKIHHSDVIKIIFYMLFGRYLKPSHHHLSLSLKNCSMDLRQGQLIHDEDRLTDLYHDTLRSKTGFS